MGFGAKAAGMDPVTSTQPGQGIEGLAKDGRLSPRRERLQTEPALEYWTQGTADAAPAPLLIVVHGISRCPRTQIERFGPIARRHGFAVAAPYFAEGDWDDFQRLGRRGRGARADLALLRLISRLQADGIATREVFLFGYSGGGQFAHRFAMAHPDDVRATVVAAPGWYTFPDPALAYPRGLRVGDELPGVSMSPADLLRVPMRVVVGALDIERDQSLRSSARIIGQQGKHRLERATRWVDAMNRAATRRRLPAPVDLRILHDTGHSFEASMDAGLGELVFDFVVRHREGTAQ
jgi:pimeloyl-ACP methyl ester carboxylesterase